MKSVVLLARFSLQASKAEEFRELFAKAPEVGSPDRSLWLDERDPDRYLLILSFDSVEASELSLAEAADNGLVDKLEACIVGAIDARAGRRRRRLRSGFGNAPVGTYGSLSVRTASTGFSKELFDEMKRIMRELEYIEGFKGSEILENVSLSDQLITLAFWDSVASFDRSLPPHLIYEVELYRRIL